MIGFTVPSKLWVDVMERTKPTEIHKTAHLAVDTEPSFELSTCMRFEFLESFDLLASLVTFRSFFMVLR